MGHAAQRNRRSALCLAWLLLGALAAHAEVTSLPVPPSNVADALQQVARQAAVVFTGSVLSVTGDATGGATVRFAVEQGVRGVASGGGYTMHVSAWTGGAERYFPGERALFLLTAPSAAGYSAPVMGERGIVPLSGDALVGNLDLRWIATGVQRARPGASPVTQTAAVRIAAGEKLSASASAPAIATVPDVHSIDRDLVLGLLRSAHTSTEQEH